MTKARFEAMSDLRVSYNQACMLLAYSSHLPAECKWNADATTILVDETASGGPCVIVRDKNDHTPVTCAERSNSLGILIKWMHLCNAAGETGPLVLIVSVDKMAEKTFFAREVKSLSNSNAIESTGWIYFCNSKQGNDALWKHWFLNVVIPVTRAVIAMD